MCLQVCLVLAVITSNGLMSILTQRGTDEVTKRKQTGKAVFRVEIVDIPGAQACGGGGGGCMGGDVTQGLCGHSRTALTGCLSRKTDVVLISTGIGK
jgi:hypothetical protein